MDILDPTTLPVYLIFILLLIDRMINFARTLKNGAGSLRNGALSTHIIETRLLVKELRDVCVKLTTSYDKNTELQNRILDRLDADSDK